MAEDFNKKVTLIEVEVDNKSAIASVDKLTGSILDQKDAIKDNTTEVKDLEKANKDLGEQVKKGSITQDEAAKKTEQNKGKIKELNKANENLKDDLKDLNKERGQAVKVSKLQANSLDALRSKVAAQKKELNGLNTATEKGRKRFDELTKELKKNNEAIKEADQSAGDFKTSIGDYAGSAQEAGEASSLMGGSIGKAGGIMTQVGGTASKLFRLLLANPFILIVGLIAALVKSFLDTQAGMDALTSVTRPLFAIFERLKGVLQVLATKLFGKLKQAFNDPVGTIKELGKAILDNVINRFKALLVLGDAIAQLFKGNFKEAAKLATDGFIQLGTGVTNATDKINAAIAATGDFIKEGIDIGKELDRVTKEIERSEIALTTQRAKLNKTFAESQEIAKDITKTEKERVAAAQAAIKAQNDLLNAEQNFLDLKIERLKLEQTLNDTSREGELELAELVAERTSFEETAAKKRAGANAQLNSINKQIAGQEIARIKQRQAEEDKATKQEEDRLAKKLKDQRALNQKLQELDTFRREQENESALAAAETEEERFQLEIEQQQERFEIEQTQLEEQRIIALENEALSDEEKLAVEADFQLQKEELIAGSEDIITAIETDADDLRAANKDKADKEAIAKEKKKRKTLQDIVNAGLKTARAVTTAFFAVRNDRIASQNDKETKDLQTQLANGQITREQFDSLKEKLDRDSARKAHRLQVQQFRANKILTLLGIVSDTAGAIARALKNPPGPPFSIAQSVAASVLGLAQGAIVASSRPPAAPSFAQGGDVFGFTVGGKSHSQGGTKFRGEDGQIFEVQKDEGIFVTKREATNPALSMLSSVNESFGGRSMFDAPRQFLQEGGAAAAASQTLSAEEISDIIAALPPQQVQVVDIMAGIQGNVEATDTGVV